MPAVLRQSYNTNAILGASSVSGAPPDTTIPEFPGGTTLGFIRKTNSTVLLKTSAPATDNVLVAGYEWSFDGGASYPFTSLGDEFEMSALADLTSYGFRVRAYDGASPPNKSAHLALTTSTYRAGATGQDIIDTTGPIGGGIAGAHFNKVVLPADANKWFSSRETTPPASGVLVFNPNGTYTFVGPDATVTYRQLEVDGVDFGTPFPIELYTQGVSVFQSGAWSVRNLVGTTQQGAWSVRNVVTAFQAGAWSVDASATAFQAGSWSVRSLVTSYQAGAWSVQGTVYTSAPSGSGFNPLRQNKIRPPRFP